MTETEKESKQEKLTTKDAAVGFLRSLRRPPCSDSDDHRAEVALGGSTRQMNRKLSRDEEDVIFEQQEGGTLHDTKEPATNQPLSANPTNNPQSVTNSVTDEPTPPPPPKTTTQRLREWTGAGKLLWGSSKQ